MYRELPVVKRAIDPLNKRVPTHVLQIHGRLYDVADFDHPGGQLFIEMTKGCDATLLFETHHIDDVKARTQLDRLPSVPVECDDAYEMGNRPYDLADYRAFKRRAWHFFRSPSSRRMSMPEVAKMWTIVLWSLYAHVAVSRCTVFTLRWLVACTASSFCNSLIGGYGHNGLHILSPSALGLDWNGLSSYEWLHEHIHSHHMYTNTVNDHDAISMLPFLAWIPGTTPGVLARHGKHLIYAISEIAVAINGNFVHMTRWRLTDTRLPLWMRLGPALFIARCATYFWCQGARGAFTLLLTLTMAGYYFTYLAHLTHVYGGDRRPNFLLHQLANTKDIDSHHDDVGVLVMFLDRQTLHHLLPPVDHTRLTRRVKHDLSVDSFMQPHSWIDLARKTDKVLEGKFE